MILAFPPPVLLSSFLPHLIRPTLVYRRRDSQVNPTQSTPEMRGIRRYVVLRIAEKEKLDQGHAVSYGQLGGHGGRSNGGLEHTPVLL